MICVTLFGIMPAMSARVAADSTPAAGAHASVDPDRSLQQAAKPSGTPDIRTQPVFTHARKRAYKRALVRAQSQGCTRYRGRTMSLQQLAGMQGRAGQPASAQNARRRTPLVQGSDVCLLSWNVGGLSNAILDELFIWLSLPQHCGIKIILLQETRWQFSSEWENDSWFIVHSGHSKQKGSGVMTLISKDLCCAEDIRTCEIASGRVLHTRVPAPGGQNSLDIVNVYQHAWDTRADAAELKRKRARILEKVDACLQQVPWRNLCICAGDWNVQLAPLHGLVGNSAMHRDTQRQSAPDSEALRDVLIARHLVALNTWSGLRRQAFTFEHQGCRTQIDFVFARRHQVTTQMRQCKPLQAFPVTAWRQSGLHRPLAVALDYRWQPKPHTTVSRRVDIDAVAVAVQRQTPQLHAFQNEVLLSLQHQTITNTLDLHQVLYDCCVHHFPAASTRRLYAHQNSAVQQIVRSRWLHLQRGKLFRRLAATDLASAWRCWHHFARFRALRREANRASRQARKQRFEHLLLEAEHYASRNNTHKLYAIIRQLAPRQPFRRVKIYGDEGEILSRADEVDRLRGHFQNIFQGNAESWAHECDECVDPPTLEDVRWALEKTPLRKAVPKHLAPGAAWRAAASLVAPYVHRTVQEIWRIARVPQHWKDGWLMLMRKPNKQGRGPSDFRPLCLQDPCGKAVIKLLACNIRSTVQDYAARCPQHAYLPQRSTEGALLGIFARCRQVRQLTQQAGNSVFTRRAGTASAQYTGGYILSLDMSMAFDAVPRVHVRDSLLAAGVGDKDVQIIMAWLTESTYHLQHAHINLRIMTERGVRQGCVLSPLIWTCFTCYVAYKLESLISLDDLQIYADDFLLSKIFHTKQQFLEALQIVPKFLSMLTFYGLKVNVQKTAMLIRMAHAVGRHLLSQHMYTNSKGTFLSWLQEKPLRIPVKRSHVYLGCVISFYDFESLTLKHRMEAAKTQFSRLRGVLTSTRCLSLKRRARIWRTCIWTTLTYGWPCCGCSGYMLSQVLGLVNTQLRAVARSPRHITQTSNQEVYTMLGLHAPTELLTQVLANLQSRLALTLQSDDIVMQRSELHDQAAWAREQLADAMQGCHRLERLTPVDGVACPECGIYFDCESSMRKHKSRKHPDIEKTAPVDMTTLPRELFCVDGMPICRGCGKQFHHMQTLLRHVANRRCPGLTAIFEQKASESQKATEEPIPIVQRVQFLESCSSGGTPALLDALQTKPALRRELMEHCCICRQWISDPRHFKIHMQKSHKDIFDACQELALADCSGLTGAIISPCSFCGKSFTKKPRHAVGCSVLFQVAFSCRAHERDLKRRCALTIRGSSSCHQPTVRDSSGITERRTSENAGNSAGKPRTGSTGTEEKVGQCRETSEVPEAGRGEGEGPRKESQKGQTPARGLHAFFGPGSRDHAASSHRQTLSKARGLHQHTTGGPGLHDDLQDSRGGNHVVHDPQSVGQVDGIASIRSDRLSQAHGPAQRYPSRTTEPCQGPTGGRCQDTNVGSVRMVDQAGRSRASMDATNLERCATEGDSMPGCRPPATFGRDQGAGHTAGARVRSDCAAIPSYQEVGRGVRRGDHGVQAGGQPERRTGDEGAPCVGTALQLGHLAPGGSPAQNTGAEAGSVGEEASGHALRQVLTLRLHNTGNSCYQNAFIMSWLWATVKAYASEVGGHIDDRIGRCLGLVNALLMGRFDRLTKVFAWSAILQQWPRPQQQHDIGEFATHALPRLRSTVMRGMWYARAGIPASRDVDRGPLHLPILMPIPTDACTIQQCVEAWCHQEDVHALGNASPLLLVQLGRFRHRAHRHVRKYKGVIELDGIINMPVYTNDSSLDVVRMPYRVIAGAFHVGNTPSSGHYRAMLSEAGDAMGHRNPGVPLRALENAYETDDGRIPRKLEHSEQHLVLTNTYLVWLLKC